MSDLTLFDIEAPAWTPVRRELTDDVRALLDRFSTGTSLPTDEAEWKRWYAGKRCSECGGFMRKLPWSHGCDGTTTGPVCDGCAALVTHWGLYEHDDARRDELTAAQARRRASYLKSHDSEEA